MEIGAWLPIDDVAICINYKLLFEPCKKFVIKIVYKQCIKNIVHFIFGCLFNDCLNNLGDL